VNRMMNIEPRSLSPLSNRHSFLPPTLQRLTLNGVSVSPLDSP
jgi:hypothetical protein